MSWRDVLELPGRLRAPSTEPRRMTQALFGSVRLLPEAHHVRDLDTRARVLRCPGPDGASADACRPCCRCRVRQQPLPGVGGILGHRLIPELSETAAKTIRLGLARGAGSSRGRVVRPWSRTQGSDRYAGPSLARQQGFHVAPELVERRCCPSGIDVETSSEIQLINCWAISTAGCHLSRKPPLSIPNRFGITRSLTCRADSSHSCDQASGC